LANGSIDILSFAPPTGGHQSAQTSAARHNHLGLWRRGEVIQKSYPPTLPTASLWMFCAPLETKHFRARNSGLIIIIIIIILAWTQCNACAPPRKLGVSLHEFA